MKKVISDILPWVITVIFAGLWWWEHSKVTPVSGTDPRVIQAEYVRDSALASAALRDIAIAKLDSQLNVEAGIIKRQDMNYAKLYAEYEKIRTSVRGLNADDTFLFFTNQVLSDSTGR